MFLLMFILLLLLLSPNPNSAIDNAYNDSSDGEIVMILVMMKIKTLLITTIMKISTMILPEKNSN